MSERVLVEAEKVSWRPAVVGGGEGELSPPCLCGCEEVQRFRMCCRFFETKTKWTRLVSDHFFLLPGLFDYASSVGSGIDR